MMKHPFTTALICFGMFFHSPGIPHAQEVTSCGDTYSGNAFLSGDLDCSGTSLVAVTLSSGSLDLAGFTLSGDPNNPSLVECTGNCTILSSSVMSGRLDGGDRSVYADGVVHVTMENVIVENADWTGIWVNSLVATNVTSQNNSVSGIQITGRRATITDSVLAGNGFRGITIGTNQNNGKFKLSMVRTTVADNADHGIDVQHASLNGDELQILNNGQNGIEGEDAKVKLANSNVSMNNWDGIHNDTFFSLRGSVILKDCTVSLNARDGVRGDTVKATDTIVTGNARRGIDGAVRKAVIKNSTVHDNLIGVTTPHLKMSDSSVLNSLYYGVSARERMILKNTTVLGSPADPGCVDPDCTDVRATEPDTKVTLSGTSDCDTSWNTATAMTLGICALD